MDKPTILTGLRANAEFHLGNYLGAILPMVEMQKAHAGDYRLHMFIPDLHSFTTPVDHDALYPQILENLKIYVAAGLDINQPDTFVYRQSYIPAHSELTVILNNFTYFGELSRMTQFKDRGVPYLLKQDAILVSQKLEKIVNDSDIDAQNKISLIAAVKQNIYNIGRGSEATSGLFIYPVLMAADILLYDAQWVPVGEDQRQHLELTRDIAMRMNNKFGNLFTVPHEWQKQLEFMSRSQGVRIRSLRNPDKKMSKSISDPGGTILLSDNPDEAAKKIMSATTDSLGSIHLDWEKQSGISNLLQISALLAEKPLSDIVQEWEGKDNYGELKNHVAEQVRIFLNDLHDRLNKVDERALMSKLEEDEAQIAKIANKTLQRVQEAVGLRPKQ